MYLLRAGFRCWVICLCINFAWQFSISLAGIKHSISLQIVSEFFLYAHLPHIHLFIFMRSVSALAWILRFWFIISGMVRFICPLIFDSIMIFRVFGAINFACPLILLYVITAFDVSELIWSSRLLILFTLNPSIFTVLFLFKMLPLSSEIVSFSDDSSEDFETRSQYGKITKLCFQLRNW